MRKEKLRKVGHCFITGCFIKPFQMIINHFLFIFHAQIARDGKLNINFKNNFNVLVMNVTQLNFLN